MDRRRFGYIARGAHAAQGRATQTPGRTALTLQRRQFLALGAVAGGGLLLRGWTGLGGATHHVTHRAAQAAIPAVDQLILTNVVDNFYDLFAKAGRFGDLTVQRTGLPSPTPLLSEHGLAYHLLSTRGDEQQEVLLDFALTERSLTNNYLALKVDPARATNLILSHGHFDHYGALPSLLGELPDWAGSGITLYAGGDDTFCHRWVVTPDGTRLDYGQLDRPGLEALGVTVVVSEEPSVVAGHAVTSGQIPRVTDFEKPPATARLEVGAPGTACGDSMHFPPGAVQVEGAQGDLVQDNFAGEHATAYSIANRGLVIISSCGHSGIINSIRQLQSVTGIDKVHAVVGGWHLAPAPDAIIAKTIDGFKQINPDYLIPMHCTGLATIAAIMREMPEKLIAPSTGTRIVFGA